MQATPFKLLDSTLLSATPTTSLYTVTATSGCIVKEIRLCNTDTASAWTVTLYDGTTAQTANIQLNQVNLNAKETKWITCSTKLNNGDHIWGGASGANAIAITISAVNLA